MHQNTPTSIADTESYLYHSALTEFQGVIQTASSILSEFHDVTVSSRLTLTECDTVLRKKLSQNASLRHKDFNQWFQSAVTEQEQTETELRTSVQEYLAEQTEFSEKIIAELSMLRALRGGRRNEVVALLNEFSRLQEIRRQSLKAALLAFRESQEKWQADLKVMLSEAKEIRLNDVKMMFEKFKLDSERRRARMYSRRVEVASMLKKFKRARPKLTSKPNF